MAFYRDESRVQKANPHAAFETVHKPGMKVLGDISVRKLRRRKLLQQGRPVSSAEQPPTYQP
jgi:hypothetical protein